MGMFSIPLGDNIKVSLQLLIVFIIGLTAVSYIDTLVITSLYLALGFILPIFAGFQIGLSPTFGYIISFVIISFPLYFINKIPKINPILRMALACLISLIICYIIGSLFMMYYLSMSIEKVLLIAVLPYIPFDIAKIIVAVLTVKILPQKVKEL